MTANIWNTKTYALEENASKTLLRPDCTVLPRQASSDGSSTSTRPPSSTSWLPSSLGGAVSGGSSALPSGLHPEPIKSGGAGGGLAAVPEEVDAAGIETFKHNGSSDAFGAGHLLRSFFASLAAWAGGGLLFIVMTGNGNLPFGLSWPELWIICLVGLVLYLWQLYTCNAFWSVMSPTYGGGHAFALRVRALRDAGPLVELVGPDANGSERYEIAEWQDETRPAEMDSFEGAPRGLFLITFPLVLIPGDSAETAALECARSAIGSAQGRSISFDSRVSVRMRLQWPDGSVSGSPTPHVLAEGSEAHQVRPLLLLAAVLYLGLVADLWLRLSLRVLEWPVCKRIFTLRGNSVGVIRLEITPGGDINLDGDDETLRRANRYWLAGKDWDSIWESARDIAPQVLHLRRLRTYLLYIVAAVATVTITSALSAAFWHDRQSFSRDILVNSALVLLVSASFAGVLECLIARRIAAWADTLGLELGSASACGASWSPEGRPRDTLVLTVEQRAPAGATPNKAYVSSAQHEGSMLSGAME